MSWKKLFLWWWWCGICELQNYCQRWLVIALQLLSALASPPSPPRYLEWESVVSIGQGMQYHSKEINFIKALENK